MRSSQQTVALVVLVLLVSLAIAGNILLTVFFYDGQRFQWPVFFVALGLLVSQPCLLSIWCAMGGERGLWRIPAATGILFVLLAIYIKTMEVLDTHIPLEVIIMISVIALAITVILQIPLWIFRQTTRQVIRLPSEASTNLATNQFGIKHLLVVMTIAAIVVAIARSSFPESNFDGGAPAGLWTQLSLLLLFLICVGCLMTFLALAAVFSQTKRRLFRLLLGLFLLVCPLASIQFMINYSSLFGTGDFSFTEMINMYLFFWSLAAGIVGIMWIFYLIGYRLERIRQAT